MRFSFLVLLILLLSGIKSFAQTSIETQPVKELKPTGSLSSCGYTPTVKEKLVYEKLDATEQATGSFMAAYSIHKKEGKFVSWFGIVRGISQTRLGENKLALLLEQKYFDGITDCHIMMVSQSGDGDFLANLDGDAQSIPALSLVRVYGKVVEEKNNTPLIAVDYIRVWPWLTFTLTDLGAGDHSNPRWTKICKPCKGGRIYNPYPNQDYYLKILGNPKDFGLNLVNTR
ncbi:MAG TPA: hypothetical protein VGI16_12570 [Candidatus Acidoferrum sp.]